MLDIAALLLYRCRDHADYIGRVELYYGQFPYCAFRTDIVPRGATFSSLMALRGVLVELEDGREVGEPQGS